MNKPKKPKPVPITWINGEAWMIIDDGEEWSIFDGTPCPERPWDKPKAKPPKKKAKSTKTVRASRGRRKPAR